MNVGKQFAFLYGANESQDLIAIRDIAYNLYQGSRSVRDQTVTKFLSDKNIRQCSNETFCSYVVGKNYQNFG